jgi:hypothetical protein
MFILISYETPQRRLRLLAGDSETNRALAYFDFAFSPSSIRRGVRLMFAQSLNLIEVGPQICAGPLNKREG